MKKRTMFLWSVNFDNKTSINVSATTFPKALRLAIKEHNKDIKQRVTAKNISCIRKVGEW